jgi:hypothetical protein
MDPSWCYLCRVEGSGADPRAAWGLDVWDASTLPWERRIEPMTPAQAGYLKFLCREFGTDFDATLSEGETDVVIESFLDEPMNESQVRTLEWLSAQAAKPFDAGLTYGAARSEIRKLVALRGLRSA